MRGLYYKLAVFVEHFSLVPHYLLAGVFVELTQ